MKRSQFRRGRSARPPMLVAAVVLACASVSGTAAAASAPPGAKAIVSISAPREVVSGTRFLVSGRLSGEGASGRVVVQVNRGSGWDALARARARDGRFQIVCVLTGEGGVSLRAVAGAGPHRAVRSLAHK